MQFSQPLGHQQFQGRQLPSGHVQHGIGQNQLNPGNQMNRHLGQFSGTANSALFNAAQTTPSQMVRFCAYSLSLYYLHEKEWEDSICIFILCKFCITPPLCPSISFNSKCCIFFFLLLDDIYAITSSFLFLFQIPNISATMPSQSLMPRMQVHFLCDLVCCVSHVYISFFI